MESGNTTRMSDVETYKARKKLLVDRYGDAIKKAIREVLDDAEKYDGIVSISNIDKLVKQILFDELPDEIDIASFLRLPDFILTNKGWRNTYVGRRVLYNHGTYTIVKDNIHASRVGGKATSDYVIEKDGVRVRVSQKELRCNGSNKWLVN